MGRKLRAIPPSLQQAQIIFLSSLRSFIMTYPVVSKKKPDGLDLYARFALAGALGCSVTHSAFTPVDVYVFI